jgi:ubiquinone/menaquinone biosynthesis C-methylase UbiE
MRREFDPARRALVGLAQGVVLEVGAGGGQTFPWYDPARVTRVEAVEPDATMLQVARQNLTTAPVPITLVQAAVEALPFPAATFDSVVSSLVFCSVADPAQGMRELMRVLKPGGRLLLLEHVRAARRATAMVQDALIPLTTRFMGNDHWNRDTVRTIQTTGFLIIHTQPISGGLTPLVHIEAIRPATATGDANY